MNTTEQTFTAAQMNTTANMEAEHGPAYWRTACRFEGRFTTGLSICFADGYGFIITEQGTAVPA